MGTVEPPFARSATFYDAVYAAKGKAYGREVASLLATARANGVEPASVLDVACGTGEHLRHFAATAGVREVAGVDACGEMIAVARAKVPAAALHVADMRRMELGRRFDLITCLFSSVGYLATAADLDVAIAAMARHRAPEGVVLVEPPLAPARVRPPERQRLVVRTRDGEVRREATASRTPAGEARPARLRIRFRYETAVERFEEEHAISLFAPREIRRAFARAGLRVSYEAEGPSGIGLYVGCG